MKNTIVTICDKNCYWGAILLAASFRKNEMKEDIVICAYDLDKEMISCLEQFDNTTVLDLKRPSNANPTTFKAEAMLRIDSELITWMDSDCIVTGNISDLFARDTEFRFRLRSEAEMKNMPYFGNPKTGGISEKVKKIWQKDIGDLETSNVDSIGSACCFTIHQKYKPFLEVWKQKMLEILPTTNTGVTNKQLGAYAQLDESVLNACVAFSSIAPKVEQYLGNLYPERHIMHFIGKRKPWSGWNPRSFPYFKIVMEILDWAEANYSLPARPLSLQRNQFSKINLRIKKDKIIEYLKRQVKKVIRRKV